MDCTFATVRVLCLIAAGSMAWTVLGCTPATPSPQASATPGRPAPSASPAASPTPASQATTAPGGAPSPTAVVPAGAGSALAAVLKDLAQRQKVDESQVTVVRAEAVDWPDSSLGCPQPGMMYLQVITPGYRLVLSAGGVSVEYHTDAAGRFATCQ